MAKISRTSSLNGKKSGSYKKSEFSILDNCSKFIKNGSSANKWGNWSCSLSYKKSWYPFDFKVSYPLIEPSKFLMDFFYCSWLLRFLYGLYLNPLRIGGWGDPQTPSGGMVHKRPCGFQMARIPRICTYNNRFFAITPIMLVLVFWEKNSSRWRRWWKKFLRDFLV